MDEEVHEENAEEILGDEKFQENDTEREYRYNDDFFEVGQSFDSEEEEPCEEREWEEIEEKLCRL